MIRFIDLNDQIVGDYHEFCFYDTVSDTFIDFGGQLTFDRLEDFVESYNMGFIANKTDTKTFPLKRFTEKIPDKYRGLDEFT